MELLQASSNAWTQKDLLTLVLGFFLGGLASFGAWWVVTHMVVPSLAFSKVISKKTITDGTERNQYRIKLVNTGRRDIIDIEFFARAYLHVTPGAPNLTVVDICLSQDRVPLMPKRGQQKLIKLLPETTVAFGAYPFPQAIRDKYQGKTLTLEDVLALDSAARLQFLAFGYDAFSGARRLWQQEYTAADIHARLFKKGSLEVSEEKADGTAPASTTAATADRTSAATLTAEGAEPAKEA